MKRIRNYPPSDRTCAVQSSGKIFCWGYNASGSLGNGTSNDAATPTAVSGITNGKAVSIGIQDHVCAVTADNEALCWGNGVSGELGNGMQRGSSSPFLVPGVPATAIAAGTNHSCAVTVSGGVKCWGAGTYGELGNDPMKSSLVPVDVDGLTEVIAIGAGRSSTCAVRKSGEVVCWGRNEQNSLGDGSGNDSLHPVPAVGGRTKAIDINCNSTECCVLDLNGGESCWGG